MVERPQRFDAHSQNADVLAVLANVVAVLLDVRTVLPDLRTVPPDVGTVLPNVRAVLPDVRAVCLDVRAVLTDGRLQHRVSCLAVAVDLIDLRFQRHTGGLDRLDGDPVLRADLLQDDPLAMDEVPR